VLALLGAGAGGAGLAGWRLTCASAALFGAAHVHHGVAAALRGAPVLPALAGAAAQAAYTSAFGAAATSLLRATRCLPAVMALHAACNVGGLPRLDWWERDRGGGGRWLLAGVHVVGLLGAIRALGSAGEGGDGSGGLCGAVAGGVGEWR
jgi:membrane protease YdiL (CAAX protease family)